MNPVPVSRPIKPKRLISLRLVAVITSIDAVYFSVTEPNAGNSLVIMAGIGLLGLSAYAWARLLVRIGAAFWPTSIRTQRRLAISLAAVSVVLILMQSIGQLSWRDFLAIIPFAVAFYIYLTYLTGGAPETN